MLKNLSLTNLLLIVSFLLILWLPLIQMKFNIVKSSVTLTNEAATVFENIDFKHLDKSIEPYDKFFNKNFGFRTELIDFGNKKMIAYFGYSRNANVLMGKDGWMYYSPGLVDNWMRPAYDFNFQNIVKDVSSSIGKRLTANKVLYISVVAPDKHTIYPEFLPMPDGNALRSPRMIQRWDLLKDRGISGEINLMDALMEEKKLHQIYYRTDTHWNQHGSFVAYTEIMKKVQGAYPNIQILQKSDFNIIVEKEAYIGDIARNLLINSPEDQITYKLLPHSEKTKLQDIHKLDKLLVCLDSFFDPQYYWGTVNFLKLHFRETKTYPVGCKLDQEKLDLERPNVVVNEIVERSL